ncbi:hypothetical protein UCMB321_5627 [Pseudomonas batumici]|uniref:Uncharacterized protein n=1 Tax=Pseudomonas batumici TaxID=226910 RepID=A0A0C2I5V3_9PSED|nr:hypothetical protein UCMB321_5716 [Pseudomonas batumici]KIH80596.1 hypothetical protein UCMB321_5627 [Pseudomonas batumici]
MQSAPQAEKSVTRHIVHFPSDSRSPMLLPDPETQHGA